VFAQDKHQFVFIGYVNHDNEERPDPPCILSIDWFIAAGAATQTVFTYLRIDS